MNENVGNNNATDECENIRTNSLICKYCRLHGNSSLNDKREYCKYFKGTSFKVRSNLNNFIEIDTVLSGYYYFFFIIKTQLL